MKKTTSFHLEEDILNEIESYKKEYNLSSRNVALERMLLERRFLINSPIQKEVAVPVEVKGRKEKFYFKEKYK